MGFSEDWRKDPPAEVGLEGNLYILPSNCRAQQEGDANDKGLLCLHLYCSWGHSAQVKVWPTTENEQARTGFILGSSFPTWLKTFKIVFV